MGVRKSSHPKRKGVEWIRQGKVAGIYIDSCYAPPNITLIQICQIQICRKSKQQNPYEWFQRMNCGLMLPDYKNQSAYWWGEWFSLAVSTVLIAATRQFYSRSEMGHMAPSWKSSLRNEEIVKLRFACFRARRVCQQSRGKPDFD